MFATGIENSLSQYFVAGCTKRVYEMFKTDYYN